MAELENRMNPTAAPMAPTPTQAPTSSAQAAGTAPSRRTVDLPTRVFHALMAGSFTVAWLTADTERWRDVHMLAGGLLAGLLMWRIAEGLIGPRHRRLALLARRIGGPVRSLAAGLQNPAAWARSFASVEALLLASSMVALLGLIVPMVASGVVLWQAWGGEFWLDLLEELHEALGDGMLAMVLIHVAVVAWLSLQRRRGLALSMLTGRMPGAGPDLVPRLRWAVALALLAGAGAWVAWLLTWL